LSGGFTPPDQSCTGVASRQDGEVYTAVHRVARVQRVDCALRTLTGWSLFIERGAEIFENWKPGAEHRPRPLLL
jgi:hypothetical protein